MTQIQHSNWINLKTNGNGQKERKQSKKKKWSGSETSRSSINTSSTHKQHHKLPNTKQHTIIVQYKTFSPKYNARRRKPKNGLDTWNWKNQINTLRWTLRKRWVTARLKGMKLKILPGPPALVNFQLGGEWLVRLIKLAQPPTKGLKVDRRPWQHGMPSLVPMTLNSVEANWCDTLANIGARRVKTVNTQHSGKTVGAQLHRYRLRWIPRNRSSYLDDPFSHRCGFPIYVNL